MGSATGPASNAALCGDVDDFNAFSFSPGDIIYWSGLGGTFTDYTLVNGENAVMHVSSGADGNIIEIIGVDSATIEVESGLSVGTAHKGIFVLAKTFFKVSNFAFTQAGDAAGNEQFIRSEGATGLGSSDSNAVFEDMTITGSGAGLDGDGISLAGTGWVRVNNVDFTDHNGGASEQPLTTHNTSRLDVYNSTLNDCEQGAVPTNDSTMNLFNCTINDATQESLRIPSGATAATLYMQGGTINASGTARMFDSQSNDTDNLLSLKDVTINTSGTGSASLIDSRSLFDTCTFNINQTGGYISLQSTGGLLTTFKDCTFNLTATNANGFLQARTAGTNPDITQQGGTVNYLAATNEFFYADDDPAGQIRVYSGLLNGNGNTLTNLAPYRLEAATPYISNLTVVDINCGTFGPVLVDVDGAVIRNSVFHNVTGTNAPIHLTASAAPDIDNNCYSGTTPDNRSTYGDTGTSLVEDPQFADEAADDFRLKSGSPLLGAGADWWTALGEDAPLDRSGKPITAASPIGAFSQAGAGYLPARHVSDSPGRIARLRNARQRQL